MAGKLERERKKKTEKNCQETLLAVYIINVKCIFKKVKIILIITTIINFDNLKSQELK